MESNRKYVVLVDMGYRNRTGQNMIVPFVDDAPGSGPSMKIYTGAEIAVLRVKHQLRQFDWIAIDIGTMQAEVV